MTLLHTYTKHHKQATFALAGIFAARMLGMFMLLPVLTIAAADLSHASPRMLGMALGVYGLCQAALQVPFGMLSDRLGRKPVIIFGLMIFAIGSIIAALSDSVYGLILGRALQGSGAVGSTIIALVADLTPEDKRTYAMAIIGMTIGASFGVAMLLGPIINQWAGLPGIFWATTGLAALGILTLIYAVPTPQSETFHRDAEPIVADVKQMLTNPTLKRLDASVFTLHAVLSALFLIIPKQLLALDIPLQSHWKIYVPALTWALLMMIAGTLLAEKYRKMKEVLVHAILLLIISIVILWQGKQSVLTIGFSLSLFLGAFSILEACLPSVVSKVAPASAKGTAIGIYSTMQFLGIFAGGSLGGTLIATYGDTGVYSACLIACCMWGILMLTMKRPQHLSTQMLQVGTLKHAKQLEDYLLSHPGIFQISIEKDDGIAYLKYDSKITSIEAIDTTIEHWLEQHRGESQWQEV